MPDEISRLRQLLARAEGRRKDAITRLLALRTRLLRGSLGERGKRCGNPNCRCARGELHRSHYLSASVDGRTRQVHVPAEQLDRVRRAAEAWHLFQGERSAVRDLADEEDRLLEQLALALLDSWPEESPLPPPGRRGRKPKDPKEGGGGPT